LLFDSMHSQAGAWERGKKMGRLSLTYFFNTAYQGNNALY
jgi:hypothetical protein